MEGGMSRRLLRQSAWPQLQASKGLGIQGPGRAGQPLLNGRSGTKIPAHRVSEMEVGV